MTIVHLIVFIFYCFITSVSILSIFLIPSLHFFYTSFASLFSFLFFSFLFLHSFCFVFFYLLLSVCFPFILLFLHLTLFLSYLLFELTPSSSFRDTSFLAVLKAGEPFQQQGFVQFFCPFYCASADLFSAAFPLLITEHYL